MELRDYQRQAVGFLKNNRHAGLFLDPGLGKTATVLSSLTPEHLPALVVAPKRVAENVWPEEGGKWRPDLHVIPAKGSKPKRLEALASDADVVSLGRDNLADAVDLTKFRTLVIDESSGFKNRDTKRFKMAKKMVSAPAPSYENVWELTGTPSPNGYQDLWSQLYLLDRGKRLYPTITKYRTRYFTPRYPLPNGIIPGYDIKPGAEHRINELISDICLSMTTDGRLELPEFTVNKVQLEMPPAARKAYKEFERDFVIDLDMLGGELHTASQAAVLSGKLSQVSSGALYHDESDGWDELHHVKLDALQEIMEDNGGYPVLVFVRFKHEVARVKSRFGSLCHTVAEKDWYDRWNRGELPMLVAHPAAIGHGLNLQSGGHTIVWFTPDWSLELWEQANKRLHRSGQTHPVVAHVLCASRVDIACLERLESKTSVERALMHYLEGVAR